MRLDVDSLTQAAAVRGIGPRLAVRLAAMDDPNDVDQELADEAERVIGDLNANMGAIVRGEGDTA